MFFKGIKYYFLFLICLFSVNFGLKSQGGSKGSKSPESSTQQQRQVSPPPVFHDFYESDDDLTPKQRRGKDAEGFKPSEQRSQQSYYSARTQSPSSVRGAQTVSTKKPSQLEIAINEAALRRQINEGKKVFDQIQAAQDADIQRDALQRGGRPKSYDDYLAEGLDSDQAYLRSVGGQQAARIADLEGLDNQTKKLRKWLQILKTERENLSEDDRQALARNVQQVGEITKKLNELNERRRKLEEGPIDDAFDRMMASRYPGFGQ